MINGTREEISDMINPSAYDDKKFKKGLVLRFQEATIKITRVDRTNKRCWGVHMEMIPIDIAMSHYGHKLELGSDPVFCKDCQMPVSIMATTEGNKRANIRRDNADRTRKSSKKATRKPEDRQTG